MTGKNSETKIDSTIETKPDSLEEKAVENDTIPEDDIIPEKEKPLPKKKPRPKEKTIVTIEDVLAKQKK